jgi:hypothetical protein
MQSSARKQGQWPFPSETDDAEDDVDDLQYGDGLHSGIEVFGEKIPEDFGPEEAFKCSSYLIYLMRLVQVWWGLKWSVERTRSSREDDEARPVVLD